MYKEKINALVEAMKEDNFQKVFEGDQKDAFSTLEDALTSFPNYVNTVVTNEVLTPIWRMRLEGDDLRDQIQRADANRRSKHEDAITSVRVLNRLSEAYELEPFADIDTNDRYQVADFAGEYVSEIYEDGTSHTMDKTVETAEAAHQTYTKRSVEDIIADAQEKLQARIGNHSRTKIEQSHER